ncbi:MAG: cadmium-translocating P-type ATPase, partial [Bacteroidota bacterium]
MKHEHKYDANGKQLCCTLEEKINKETNIDLSCCAVDSK